MALQITEGTKCGHIPRSTEVRFYCAMKQNPFISEVDTCQYQLSLFHPDYCTEVRYLFFFFLIFFDFCFLFFVFCFLFFVFLCFVFSF